MTPTIKDIEDRINWEVRDLCHSGFTPEQARGMLRLDVDGPVMDVLLHNLPPSYMQHDGNLEDFQRVAIRYLREVKGGWHLHNPLDKRAGATRPDWASFNRERMAQSFSADEFRKQYQQQPRPDDHIRDSARYHAGPFNNEELRRKRDAEEDIEKLKRWTAAHQKDTFDKIFADAMFGTGAGRMHRSKPSEHVDPKYSEDQRKAIDKARKAKAMRDDDRCDKGTRDNAGRMLHKMLSKHKLTEMDLF